VESSQEIFNRTNVIKAIYVRVIKWRKWNIYLFPYFY
jgi:hypothetical protein